MHAWVAPNRNCACTISKFIDNKIVHMQLDNQFYWRAILSYLVSFLAGRQYHNLVLYQKFIFEIVFTDCAHIRALFHLKQYTFQKDGLWAEKLNQHYTGWPRKNATLTINTFKKTRDKMRKLCALMRIEFFPQQNDTNIIDFDEGVLILYMAVFLRQWHFQNLPLLSQK